MEPETWPLDPLSSAALVVRLVDEIDIRTEEQDVSLLCDLMCAAWGSVRAQNQ
ncbi:MAG: hypothetical protein ACLQBB_11650 [Solirubrobacteraceae bacterium]